MSSEVHFFTAVTYENIHTSVVQCVLEHVDNYFCLDGRKAQVIDGHAKDGLEGVILVNTTSSYLETTLKIASYCTIIIPTILLIAKAALRSLHRFYFITNVDHNDEISSHIRNASDVSSITRMHSFWKQHVQSFTIRHGTSSLYHKHFTQYGITSSYPKPLENLILNVRKVWANHEHDITYRTGYFRDFEQRYDHAQEKQEIAISFSARADITSEFTVGARQGGEWIRELGHFLRVASTKQDRLSPEEQMTLLELESFIEVMNSIPSMIVSINAGCPDLTTVFGVDSLLTPLPLFIEYVKSHCSNWQGPQHVADYMNATILPRLEDEKRRLASRYEITIHNAVRAEYLSFEFIGERKNTIVTSSISYLHLEFNKPQKVTNKEIIQLRMNRAGFSDIDEYQDSRFVCEYSVGDGTTVVTRRLLEDEDMLVLRMYRTKEKMKKYWLQVFGYETR